MKSKDSVAILVSIIIIVVSFGLFNNHLKGKVTQAEAKSAPTNKITELVSPVPSPTIQSVVVGEQEQPDVAEEIRRVFGKHSDKAFQLLSCENAHLNPDAVNTAGNYPAGSRDIGVFQVNEYWQGVHAKFLFNYKTNIQIAHQIFEESDNSFKMWSCGKRLGI